jgi:tetratricopeptide (TPR) repeat protein
VKYLFLVLVALIFSGFPQISYAVPTLYAGKMVIEKTYGGGCGKVDDGDSKKVSIGLDRDSEGKVFGWFLVEGLAPGKLIGDDLTRLAVDYPLYNKSMPEGHQLSLALSGQDMVGTLSDRPFHDTLEQCSIVAAQLTLTRTLQEASDWMALAEKRFAAAEFTNERQYWRALDELPPDLSALEDSLAQYENKTDVGNRLALASGLTGLADFYQFMGFNTPAEQRYQGALELTESALGPEHPLTAMGLYNLATFYSESGKHAAAEPLYRKALKIREAALGSDHPQTVMCLESLASTYQELNRFSEAVTMYERAIVFYERIFGPERSGKDNVRSNLKSEKKQPSDSGPWIKLK